MTPERDYRYRVLVRRGDWAGYVASAAGAIDYPNFKSEVARRQGSDRAHTFGDVWSVMYELQRRGDAA